MRNYNYSLYCTQRIECLSSPYALQVLQFFSAMYRIYLYNCGVLGWYLKYRFGLRTKKRVIIEQNNICFNRNMLMLGCVTLPSWQRLALSLWTNWARNAHRREFLTSSQVLGLRKLHLLILTRGYFWTPPRTEPAPRSERGSGVGSDAASDPRQCRCLGDTWALLRQKAQVFGAHFARTSGMLLDRATPHPAV